MIDISSEPTFTFRPYNGLRTFPINSDAHALQQGLSTFVFPSTYRDGSTLDIKILGSDQDVETAKSILNSIGQYGHERNARDVVARAGNAIAQNICSRNAIAMYELVRSDNGPVLLGISPRYVHEAGGVLYSHANLSLKRWKPILAKSRRFWVIRFPLSLGGSRRHQRLLDDLNGIGPFMPRFRIEASNYSLDPAMAGYKYDYVTFLTSSTQKLGWYGGGAYFEFCSEYYILHRSLNAKRAKLKIRKHIIDSINIFFKQISLDCTIECSGGSSLNDCDQYEEKFRNGLIATNELSKWISHNS